MKRVVICLLTALLGGGPVVVGAPPVADKPDWKVVADNLWAELGQTARDHAQQPADVLDSNLPLAHLEIEKLHLRLNSVWKTAAYEAEQERSAATAEEALARVAAGRVGHIGETGGESPTGYLTRAYRCRTDGSPQPYFVRLPADYNPARAYPLVLFLHGYVTETSKIDPWVLPSYQWQMATDRGLILCLPHGRRNSDFLGIGEVDTLRVIEEMRRWYNIDPDRIVLTGCSMGGYGGWAVGLRQPDRFAGLGVMAGQTDFFTWERRDRAAVPFKSWCILQNNPLDLAANALHLPIYVQHGELDNLVPVEHSRLIAPVMRQLGYDFVYEEVQGQGHYIYWDDPPFQRLFDFCARVRRQPRPARVRYVTYTPKQGRCYWLDIRRLTRWGPPATIDATIADGQLTITTENVAELWLDVPAELAPAPLALSVNGEAAGQVAAGPHRVLLEPAGRPSPATPGTPPTGRPRVGPAREVFNAPFQVVYATGGTPAQQTRNRNAAARFQQVWWQFAEGLAKVVADRQLDPETARTHNLVIFGEPGATTIPGLPDPAATLPEGVTIADGAYTVAGRTMTGEDLGIFCLVPHPLHDQGLILWCAGATYGQGLPVNHQFDLLPDLLVYNQQRADDGANQFLVGGFFDQDWRLEPSLLDWAPAP